MHILQPLLDISDLIRSKPILLLLAVIAVVALASPYFFAQGAADWSRRSLSFLLVGGGGTIVLIALGKIIYSSLVVGDYTFGTIFASLMALLTLFALSVLAVRSLSGEFETPFLFLSLIASLFLSLILSTAIALLRRVFF